MTRSPCPWRDRQKGFHYSTMDRRKKQEVHTYFSLYISPNLNCYTWHTSLILKWHPSYIEKGPWVQKVYSEETLTMQCKKIIKHKFKTKKKIFFSLNIPWCKRKILYVKTFLSDELWWSITQDLRWMCVFVHTPHSFSFALYFNATFFTIILLAGLDGSTCYWVKLQFDFLLLYLRF